MAAIALTAIVQITIAAEETRKLEPVDELLDKIQGSVKKARELAAKDLEKAREALRIAAPSLAEMMRNLGGETKRLEQETTKLSEKVGKQKKAEIEAAKDLLGRQRQLNNRINRVKQVLRSDANAQDMTQKEGRERARDADDAVAMLEDPPRDAKNALEESTANKAPKEQQQSLDTAAQEQKKLADTLEQLAEHYQNLENGEGDKTRAGLREKEGELGIKEALDEQYGAIEQLVELSGKPLDEVIKVLEEKLKDNPVMQEELQNIAETTIQEAKTDLDIEAQERKQQIVQNAKSEQQEAGDDERKPTTAEPDNGRKPTTAEFDDEEAYKQWWLLRVDQEYGQLARNYLRAIKKELEKAGKTQADILRLQAEAPIIQ